MVSMYLWLDLSESEFRFEPLAWWKYRNLNEEEYVRDYSDEYLVLYHLCTRKFLGIYS